MFLFVGVICPIVSFALDVEQAKIAMAEDLAKCAGFYFAMSVLKNGNTSPPTEVSKALFERGKQANKLATTYSADEKQLGQIGGAAAEMFIFMSTKPEWEKTYQVYAENCKSILEKPEDRFQFLLNK